MTILSTPSPLLLPPSFHLPKLCTSMHHYFTPPCTVLTIVLKSPLCVIKTQSGFTRHQAVIEHEVGKFFLHGKKNLRALEGLPVELFIPEASQSANEFPPIASILRMHTYFWHKGITYTHCPITFPSTSAALPLSLPLLPSLCSTRHACNSP